MDIIAYTLRTIAVTEHNWIAVASTTMEDDSIQSVEEARAENLRSIHGKLATAPPRLDGLGIKSNWRDPYDDMKVVVHDTVIRQDLMTGLALDERESEKYTVVYSSMNH